MHLTNLKLFSQIEGKLINNFDFSKVVVSVTGDHCDYSPRVQKPSYATGWLYGDLMDTRERFAIVITSVLPSSPYSFNYITQYGLSNFCPFLEHGRL
jgi:hypothetical protein